MGYYCKIIHEDLSDYMVATAPVEPFIYAQH